MQLYFTDREAWRSWLAGHHQTEREVWLVFYKAHTGQRSMSYDAAVEEALCFGWIDSIIKKLDGRRYLRKFTPRTNTGGEGEVHVAGEGGHHGWVSGIDGNGGFGCE